MTSAGRLRTAFFGTSDFAIPALERLAAETDLAAVCTRPSRPAGRGGRERKTPVAQACRRLGLEPKAPAKLKDPALAAELRSLDLDVGVVASFGDLIPDEILAIPRHGFWNIHPSLLPRWRGAAPVQRAILQGDDVTGVSIMKVVRELDAGPIAAVEETAIGEQETAGALESRLAERGARLLLESLGQVGETFWREQDSAAATYAAKISREEERIDWTESSASVLRRLCALSPRPAAWSMLGDERIRILGGTMGSGRGVPGRVLDDRLLVACGSGAIRILEAQRSGRRAMKAADLLRGFPIPAGAQFT